MPGIGHLIACEDIGNLVAEIYEIKEGNRDLSTCTAKEIHSIFRFDVSIEIVSRTQSHIEEKIDPRPD